MTQPRNGKSDQHKPVAPKGNSFGDDRPSSPKDSANNRTDGVTVAHYDDNDLSIEEMYRVYGGDAGGA